MQIDSTTVNVHFADRSNNTECIYFFLNVAQQIWGQI